MNRHLTAVVGVLICLLVIISGVAVGFLSYSLVKADNTVAVVTAASKTKSTEITTLQTTNASQQKTIASQQKTIASFSGAAAKALARGQHQLIAGQDALDFVIIDALQGNKVALQRDRALLQQLISSLP